MTSKILLQISTFYKWYQHLSINFVSCARLYLFLKVTICVLVCLISQNASHSKYSSDRDPWRKEWQPTPLFLPGEFHGLRSLESYSSWGRKEWDMTE